MSDNRPQDRIDAIAHQLSAMLTITCGECGEPFRRLADNIQENYMWACADMARELQDLIDGLEVNHD